jgi:hypothetical protein
MAEGMEAVTVVAMAAAITAVAAVMVTLISAAGIMAAAIFISTVDRRISAHSPHTVRSPRNA